MKDRFHKKIIEIFDTTQVRHGFMVVGSTNSGKSTALKSLADAITLKNKNVAEKQRYKDEEEKYLKEMAKERLDTHEM